MKKFFSIALAALMLAACTTDRSQVLKVYNWSSYIDETLIEEFEQWYEEQTGESVKVVYQTFDINETMLSKIEKGHEDFDVVCPSDYIIERMLKNDLLLAIDKNFGDTPNYIDGSLSPYVMDCFRKFSKSVDANDYAVGYMWGTTGLLYNKSKVDAADVKTWHVISNPKYQGNVLMKDAPRDVYSQLLILFNQDKIRNADGTFNMVAMDSLMYDSSDASLAKVEKYLVDAHDNIGGWEADFGKESMTQEKALIDITWSGDAAWAIEEAAKVGVDLDFEVPAEGSTVWFDGWVIPRYAQNVKAARYFINFMCKPENAVRNVEEIGYVSCCGAPELLEAYLDEDREPSNLTYFFGEGADSVRVNPVLIPDQSIIDRCGQEHDWSTEDTEKLIAMWSRAKGESANTMTYLIVAVVVIVLGGGMVISKVNKKRSRRSRRG